MTVAEALAQLQEARRRPDSEDDTPYMSPEDVAEEIALMRAERRAELDANLRTLIPDVLSHFPKLEHGDPYRFDRWGEDRSGSACLY